MKINQKSTKVSSVIKQVIDGDTGELIDQTTEQHFTTKITPDKFYMVFIENMAPLLGLKQASDIRLITSMCGMANFNTGVVLMSKARRRELCTLAGISITNMSKNLSRLMQANLITEIDGDYTINPSIFWRGSINTRTEILREQGLTFKITLVGE